MWLNIAFLYFAITGITGAVVAGKRGSGCFAILISFLAGPIMLPFFFLAIPERRNCPHCMKRISSKALKCPFCQEEVIPLEKNKKLFWVGIALIIVMLPLLVAIISNVQKEMKELDRIRTESLNKE